MKATKKDKRANMAGMVMLIAGAIAAGGYSFIPLWAVQASGLVAVIAGAYNAYLTGKASDGKPKLTKWGNFRNPAP